MGRRKQIKKINPEDGTIDYTERKVVPINEAYVNLVLAIRQSAIDDGELSVWEHYWLGDKDFHNLMLMFLKDYKTHKTYQSDSNSGQMQSNPSE